MTHTSSSQNRHAQANSLHNIYSNLRDALERGDLMRADELIHNQINSEKFVLSQANASELFEQALRTGSLSAVKMLLDSGLISNEHLNSRKSSLQGDTPLIYATRKGQFEIIKFLVEETPADVTIENAKGETAIDVASDAVEREEVTMKTNELREEILILLRRESDPDVHNIAKETESH